MRRFGGITVAGGPGYEVAPAVGVCWVGDAVYDASIDEVLVIIGDRPAWVGLATNEALGVLRVVGRGTGYAIEVVAGTTFGTVGPG